MWKNILLAVISVFASILLLDLVLRHSKVALRFVHAPGLYYYNRFPAIHKTLRHCANVNVHASVSGDLANMLGDKTKKRNIRFITDELGFRNIKNYREDTFDTVLLGDSFGFCESTDHDDLLSEQLNKTGHSVYNISTAGINLWDEVVTLQYVIDKNGLNIADNVHILWLLFEGNDLEGEFFDEHDPDKLMNNKYKEISVMLDNYYKRSIIKLSVKRLVQKLCGRRTAVSPPVLKRPFFDKSMLFLKPNIEMLKTELNDIYHHPNSHRIKQTFHAMASFVDSMGFSLTCVVVPVKARVYEWTINDKPPWTSDVRQSAFSKFFYDLCESNGFNFIDMTSHLIATSKTVYENTRETLYWLDDTHWNDVGQKIAATLITTIHQNNRDGQKLKSKKTGHQQRL